MTIAVVSWKTDLSRSVFTYAKNSLFIWVTQREIKPTHKSCIHSPRCLWEEYGFCIFMRADCFKIHDHNKSFTCPEFYPHIKLKVICISAPQSKNAVSTNIKQSRYIHLMLNFSSNHFYTKRLYVNMFHIVDTPFSYGKGLIVC